MSLFDRRLLERFKYLSRVARRVGGRPSLAAPRRSTPGGGTEVSGVRDYAAGDDFRHIDWAWCARRDELLTRVFAGSEDRHAYVLLDCSPSMALGRPAKFDVARRIAAMLAHGAAADLERFALLAFADGIVAEAPPVRSAARFPRLLRFLEQLGTQGSRTSLMRTVETFVRRHRRRGPVVVLSDLYDRDGFERAFDLLTFRGYEPRLVQIREATDSDPGLLGEIELFDVEAETSRRVTITEHLARQYQARFAEFLRSVRQYCAKRAIDYVCVANDTREDEILRRLVGVARREACV